MRRLLRYTSSRFRPRLNEYTYPERREIRPTIGDRAWGDLPRGEARSSSTRGGRIDARR
jgi:hypothetical protein